MATYAVGDIHGRSDLLGSLLSKFKPTRSDQVVFLGDYIDRGPDSKGVIDTLLAYTSSCPADVSFLLGNHEQWLVHSLHDYRRHSWLFGMGGLETVRSYSTEAGAMLQDAITAAGPNLLIERLELPYGVFFDAMPDSHREFLTSLKPFVRTPDVVCVHAGVSADYAMVEDEATSDLVWGSEDWWSSYKGPDRIVYGHWSNAMRVANRVEPFVDGMTYGIDCVASDALMAMRFPDRVTWCAT